MWSVGHGVVLEGAAEHWSGSSGMARPGSWELIGVERWTPCRWLYIFFRGEHADVFPSAGWMNKVSWVGSCNSRSGTTCSI